MGTQLAAYRSEIRRLHEQSDDLCVAVSALLRYIARMKAAHAEEMCANAGTGGCPRCASYVETVARMMACTEPSPQDTADGSHDGRALKCAMGTIAERDEEVRGLWSTISKKDETIAWLTAELDKTKKEMKGRNRHLKRYEHSTTPGKHGYNETRTTRRGAKKIRRGERHRGCRKPQDRPARGTRWGTPPDACGKDRRAQDGKVPGMRQEAPEEAPHDLQTHT